MELSYIPMKKENIHEIAVLYADYYNCEEQGTWTYETAYKRIHQIAAMENALCLMQMEDGNVSGFAMGYMKSFDDMQTCFLEEIVVFKKYQNKGYGSLLLSRFEELARQRGANFIKLLSLQDAQHQHFYAKCGYHDLKCISVKEKRL